MSKNLSGTQTTAHADQAGASEKVTHHKPSLLASSIKYARHEFEVLLWASRMIVLIPVLASIGIAMAMFYAATVDTVQNLAYLRNYLTPSPLPEVHEQMRTDLISHVVEAIDGYLLGVVMLIFAMGMYELFICKIQPAAHSDRARGILVVHSLDDLKARLGQVILLMLIVKFFEKALSMQYLNMIDLIMLAGGILLVAAALFLTHAREHHAPPTVPHEPATSATSHEIH